MSAFFFNLIRLMWSLNAINFVDFLQIKNASKKECLSCFENKMREGINLGFYTLN